MNFPIQNTADDVRETDVLNLHGTIQDELTSGDSGFSSNNVRLLKHHGVFQQDNRDFRHQPGQSRRYEFMVRIRATGGKLSSWQLRSLLDLADELGDSNLYVTSRQGIQLAGIGKTALRPVLRYISDLGLTTSGTGGSFCCNIMCCPAPRGPANRDLQVTAAKLDAVLRPRVSAYDEIWHTGRDSSRVKSTQESSEAIDEGAFLLPQKFKISLATANDNCTEVFAQDLGLLAATENGRVVGYNMLVGGSMRHSLSVAMRSSKLAQPLAYVSYDDAVPLAKAIVAVFNKFGNRDDRGKARLKYLIQDWGIDRFKEAVEDQYGSLEPPRSIEVIGHADHLGWQCQDDHRLCLGVHIDHGCIADRNSIHLKLALRNIADRFACSFRLTAQRNILIGDIDSPDSDKISELLSHHAVPTIGSLSNVRRYASSCPGLPYCSSAVTESQRMLPELLADLESEVARLGLDRQRFTLGVAGCSFGCARCYLADIAIVGRNIDHKSGQGKFAIFLGGDSLGRRLNTIYKDHVPADQIMNTLQPLLARFKQQHLPSESLGDFFVRTEQNTP